MGGVIFRASMKACITNRKSIGDMLSLCYTPAVYSIEFFVVMLNLTQQLEYSFLMTRTRVLGRPYL